MKKIIIIGGGIAGLSAGVYARKAGFDAEIYEKNPIAGGECMGWNRNGCHIDNCIHWLTGTDSSTEMYKVWETMGALSSETTYVHSDMFFACRVGDKQCVLWNDLDKTEKELIAVAPEDEAEIHKLIQHIRYAQECQIPSKKPMDMMNIGEFIKLGMSMANMPKVTKNYGKISLAGLADRFHSPVIKALLNNYMPNSYTAYSFLVSYATMASGNGKIPAGGSLAMVMRILDKYKKLGGKIHLNKPIKKILTEDKKAIGIELDNGEIIKADYIVSAVDAHILFSKLLDKEIIPEKYLVPYKNTPNYPTLSGFQIAYKVNDSFSQKGTILFSCPPFTINQRSIGYISIKNYSYEKSFAPQGKIVIQSNISQYDDDFLFWKSLSPQEYKKTKEDIVKAVTDRIVTEYPELKDNIKILDCWTPVTYERYCGAYHGSYMGFITKPGIKASKINGKIRGIDNLYIAGQWIMSPGGLPIAAVSGKFAIQRILKSQGKPIEI